MTREEAIKYIKSRCIGSTEERDGTQWSEAMWTAIEALADRPTESDFISKAKVLETYSELYWFDSDCEVVSKAEVDKIYEQLQSLPSADRPTGEWIKSDVLPNGWHCSHCDAPVMTDDISEMLFCPHCGSYNGGEEE